MFDDGAKPTNPKDAIGCDKLPLHLWPVTATMFGALALLDGALKYGRANWREAGVRYTIYHDAMMRHMNALLEGEDYDPDSGLPHEAHILGCAAIIVDARCAGKLVDDRNYETGTFRETVETLTPYVGLLKRKHEGKTPHHYTINDTRPIPPSDVRNNGTTVQRDVDASGETLRDMSRVAQSEAATCRSRSQDETCSRTTMSSL